MKDPIAVEPSVVRVAVIAALWAIALFWTPLGIALIWWLR